MSTTEALLLSGAVLIGAFVLLWYSRQERFGEATMTGDELLQLRQDLGLSKRAFGERMGYEGTEAAEVIRRYEDGVRPIPHLLAWAVRALQDGYRPSDWND